MPVSHRDHQFIFSSVLFYNDCNFYNDDGSLLYFAMFNNFLGGDRNTYIY